DRLLTVTSDAQGQDEAQTTLERLLATGKASAVVHFALGVQAWRRGRPTEAQIHWEAALDLAPYLVVAANNRAILLAESAPPALPRALELVTRALTRAPDEPAFHDTRGRIFMRMGRWQEALADLEAALPKREDDPHLHELLGEVYEHL